LFPSYKNWLAFHLFCTSADWTALDAVAFNTCFVL